MFGRQGTEAERLMGNQHYLCAVLMEGDYLEMQKYGMYAPAKISCPLPSPSFKIYLINSANGRFVAIWWGWVMFCVAVNLLFKFLVVDFILSGCFSFSWNDTHECLPVSTHGQGHLITNSCDEQPDVYLGGINTSVWNVQNSFSKCNWLGLFIRTAKYALVPVTNLW